MGLHCFASSLTVSHQLACCFTVYSGCSFESTQRAYWFGHQLVFSPEDFLKNPKSKSGKHCAETFPPLTGIVIMFHCTENIFFFPKFIVCAFYTRRMLATVYTVDEAFTFCYSKDAKMIISILSSVKVCLTGQLEWYLSRVVTTGDWIAYRQLKG